MMAWLVAVGAVALLAVAVTMPLPRDTVALLDVGQGDSILIQNGTQQILIDGGPGMAVLERLAKELPWFDRTIEVVIATHSDQDHLEGLLHVIERYTVNLVLLPQMPHTTQLQEAWLEKLIHALKEKQIAYRFAWAGQDITVGASKLTVLAPFHNDENIIAPGRKTNNAAVVSRVDYHDVSFLFTSDVEAALEKMLVERQAAALNADILKVGHHGSKTSTTPDLLRSVTPALAVISVGENNRFGHPHPQTLERLKNIQVLRTDQMGTIRFLYEQGKWHVWCERGCSSLSPNGERAG